MSLARTMRRKARKATSAEPDRPTGQQIRLESPERNNFESFIVANYFRATAKDWDLSIVNDPHAYLERLILDQNDRELENVRCRDVLLRDEGKGQTLVVCGAGPSLKDHAAEYCAKGDQVWGCNSALPWLHSHGYKVTHGFTMDQTPQMCVEWYDMPDVEYLVASTVHSNLTEMLYGARKRVRFFHNYVGLREGATVEWEDATGTPRRMCYEDWMYALLFAPTIRAGSGLNATTRALDVASFMGFDKVYILGADCALRYTQPPRPGMESGSSEHLAWLEHCTIMHADGGNATASGATQVTLDGWIDGRLWVTKPDMMITAIWLEKMRQKNPEWVEIIGDTLPNALKGKPDEFLKTLPNFADVQGNVVLPP